MEQSHLTDGALVELLDGELVDRAAAEAHLTSCADCSGNLARLRAASALASASIAALPVREYRRPRTRRWFSYPAIAAATLLLLASVATATPVRRWITRQFAPPAVSPPSQPATTPDALSAGSGAGMLVSFAVTGGQLIIRVDSQQIGGVLELVAATADNVSAQSSSGAATEEFVVSPNELRVRNRRASTASYRVSIPPGIEVVRVFAGGRETTVRPAGQLPREIPLHRPTP